MIVGYNIIWEIILPFLVTWCYFDCMFLSCHVHVSEWIMNVKGLLAWNRRDIWSLRDCNGIRTYNFLVRKRTLNHLAKLAWINFPINHWAVLWVLICTTHLTVCSYHVTYTFQSVALMSRNSLLETGAISEV